METTNLSKIRREKMLDTINEIKKNISDEKTLVNLSMIENELTKKKYGLIWEEHEERVDKELETQIPTFEEVKDKEIISNKTDKFNFLLEGDNLHSLYLLEKTHKEDIDIIYIDPPYNTGNSDFCYGDVVLSKEDEYKHSKWLSFMQRRLVIAKKLLKRQGVIFISIDDNEYANLKLLCDDIFGETNFIGVYIKQSKVGGGNDSKFIVKEHEYCAVYSKKLNECYDMFIEHNETYLKRYKESDETGKYFWDTFARPGLKHPIVYDIIAPDGTKISNGWIRSKERFEKELNENKIKIVKNSKGQWSVFFKQYLNQNGKKPRSMTMDFGGSIDGKKDLLDVIGDEKAFSYPKSVDYIKTLISTVTVDNPIVLDFFAGSGTTGQAVAELNIQDGQKRQFILCTNNENNICENITYKRLYNSSNGVEKSRSTRFNLKYYRTAYIPRINSEKNNLHNNLLINIKNLIQLENGIEIDDKQIKVYLDEKELDKFSVDKEALTECNKIYISSDILLTSEQEKIFEGNNIEVYIIPEYYFKDEILEVA
ncbi:MAG: site-specific DNA-methyltransferase [Bacilli bacterium]|jgi:adenine-specific DNA-methyltransferase